MYDIHICVYIHIKNPILQAVSSGSVSLPEATVTAQNGSITVLGFNSVCLKTYK